MIIKIINMILNGESLKRYGFIEKKSDATNSVPVRYNLFLLAASFYFIVDMTDYNLIVKLHKLVESVCQTKMGL